jgi:hypothetical protein
LRDREDPRGERERGRQWRNGRLEVRKLDLEQRGSHVHERRGRRRGHDVLELRDEHELDLHRELERGELQHERLERRDLPDLHGRAHMLQRRMREREE